MGCAGVLTGIQKRIHFMRSDICAIRLLDCRTPFSTPSDWEISVMTVKEREIFSSLTAVPPVVVRLDGRAFHTLTAELRLEKPYDTRFNEAMCRVCEMIVGESGLEPDFAYTFSDEISIFFSTLPFNGRVEKIDSVAASYAAAAFGLTMGLSKPASFDSRIVMLSGEPSVIAEYFSWRQKEAWRNHMNAYCQHALITEGMTPQKAAKALDGAKSAAMHEMMHERGINLSKTPPWQRRGTIIFREEYVKTGYNPVEKVEVQTPRRRIARDEDLPLFSEEEGVKYLQNLIAKGKDWADKKTRL